MSLRVKKTIGIRSNLRSRDFNKKYIFVFEGEKTEKQYFEKLSNCKGELGINDLIHIEILEKLDETKSNQLSVVKSLDDYIRSIVDMKESVEVIKKRIKDMVISKFNDSDDIKIKILELIDECFIDDKYDINIDRFIDTVRGLIIDVDIDVLIEDIRNLKQSLDYDNELDEVCIIIDRDKGSFKTSQYEQVVKICDDNDYNLGISNPCFEFWLLLHFTNCKEYDEEEIRINRKTSKSRNSKIFVEKELAGKLEGSYNKSNLKFEQFKANIKNAIENEKLYEVDIEKLENNIGTRVGLIIEKMIKE